jgi:hypothetical protein
VPAVRSAWRRLSGSSLKALFHRQLVRMNGNSPAQATGVAACGSSATTRLRPASLAR